VPNPTSCTGGPPRRHVPHDTGPASRRGRALVLPRVPRFQTCLPVREDYSVAMCPMALSPPPSRGGLWCRHVSHGSRPPPGAGGVRRRHVSRGTIPPPSAWEGSGVAMSPAVLDPPPGAGGLLRRHVDLGVLWATSKREIFSRSTYSVGPTCLREVPVPSQDA
jgi:hypothetical protein